MMLLFCFKQAVHHSLTLGMVLKSVPHFTRLPTPNRCSILKCMRMMSCSC